MSAGRRAGPGELIGPARCRTDVYPDVVRLAARALLALGSLPEPDEVDGLSGFEGLDLWRASR
ncbi:MAG TPA: hypothetical protein VFI47_14685 [Acidimicrobiales bacterium]|nr:hypothetical protein [Acidimicrobiales bacterium]